MPPSCKVPCAALTIAGVLGLFGVPVRGADEPKWTEAQKGHWSFRKPERPAMPVLKNERWVRNPIDAFVMEQLEASGLTPAPEADRPTLIRRLRFDLTGLPPTPAEVAAFVADTRPDAYERLVDGLLQSEAYGERWARLWLDLARFAESDGFKSDKTRPSAWRYRDWVINAFNRDMPYDRFLRLQLAGDETAPDDSDSFVATGFNRNYPFEDNNKVFGLNRQLMLDDVTDTTASVFLGLTLACARCHDHKYDPISQRDYYRFQALFAATEPRDDHPLASPAERAFHKAVEAEHRARLEFVKTRLTKIERPYLAAVLKEKLAKLPPEVRAAFAIEPEERSASQEDLLKKYAQDMAVTPAAMGSVMKPADRTTWNVLGGEMKELARCLPPGLPTASGMADTGPGAPPVHLLFKGNFASPVEVVGPGFPSILTDASPGFAGRPTSTGTGRRTALADWMTRADHPLTGRVIVNRLWQQHFGRGIVTTTSDFGTQGTEPTHPELLDWLATELVARGWSLKAMHRLMVTSATYRQSSLSNAKSIAADPDNVLFSRMARRRLEGEAVRDAMLAVSGRLDGRLGGPSVFPDLPPGMETRGGWERSPSESDRNRRSIYVFVRRNLKYPLFDAFDFPDSNTTCPERNVSVNAPQALMLLNSGLVLDEARALAGRLLREEPERNDRQALVKRAYSLVFGRTPKAGELERGMKFLDEQPASLSGGDQLTRDLPRPMPDGYVPAQGAALVDYCHVLLNLNEFVFID